MLRVGLDIFLKNPLNRYMAKRTKSHVALNQAYKKLHKHHTWLILSSIVLIILLGVVGLKYMHTKSMWRDNSVKLQTGISKIQSLNSVEDATILAKTIATVPSNYPLIKQPVELEEYIVELGNTTKKYIVVMDKNKTILADSVTTNENGAYSEDASGEVGKTMFDGEPRSFIEKSVQYPNGVNMTVVQMKDDSGAIVGAVAISSSNVAQ